MAQASTALDHATEMLKTAQALIGHMRPPLSAPGRPRTALFLTITEQFESALILARANLVTHAAGHVRAMLEALVAMNLLAQESGYVEQMQYEKLRSERKLYENVLTNSELRPEQRADFDSRLATCKASFDRLHAQGLRPRVISKDFGKAGLADLVAPYILLCGFSHNDLAILAFRHQGDHGMTYRTPDSDDMVLTILSAAMFALVAAASPLGDIAKFPEGHFEQHYKEMDRILGEFNDA